MRYFLHLAYNGAAYNGWQRQLNAPHSVQQVLEAATLYFPNRNGNLLTGDGLNSFSVIPSGAFIVQQEFDNKYAFTNLAFVQYIAQSNVLLCCKRYNLL